MENLHPGTTGRADPTRPTRKLPTRHVCARYSVSDKTIDRWVKNPKLQFPQPDWINGRRYWGEDKLDAFDRRAARTKTAAA
jgi:predicted DNA-binding transcriptional regulator AlpA